ncbi:MAG TPA: asparagine synthase (glutamine-hydrolyzing) [Methylomirabilota bacterium]|nr:asparagine synthase (glutamine-hydrolyzing) [Methylomirabilota bacterium]
MCGIAGWVGAGGGRETLDAMLKALEHRGPDDTGRHLEGAAALGMTRLSIIDLVTGNQPMMSEDGHATLVFNGEIYNFRDLRAELAARGRRFRTQSDTEVLLRAWEEYGPACVERLRGMFAFAIWDGARRRLFLARDRLGKKPLYYWHRDGLFVFASEPKSLLLHPAVTRRLDAAALEHYAAFGYTPAARSIFDGIAKLPPGHTAILAGGALSLTRYWTLPPGPPAAAPAPPRAELLARVRAEVRDAVRVRLEADVPLGVFLSGGVDSSAIVACMRELNVGRLATFSIGFGADRSHDELPYARAVAQRFATDHHEEVLEPKITDLVAAVVRHLDEPFADSSAIPTLAVAEATARHLKVALSGIGGDETFGGYPRYLGVRMSEAWARVPRALRAAPEALARVLLPESASSRNLGDWARRFTEGSRRPMPDRYVGWTRFFDAGALAALATPALSARFTGDVEAAHRAAWAARGFGDAVDGAWRIDLATYLPDDLLTMADRMSMARSLELRAPFCDHRLVELSLGIPPAAKVPGVRLKALLKDAFADVLPREVVRRRKQGFMIPLARWLRGELRPLLEDALAPDLVRARGLWRPEAVRRLVDEHLAGRRTHGDRLWTLVMLELWTREYLDARGAWRLS